MTIARESELGQTARALVAEGKGILAADESTRTMTKRLEAVGAASSEETRRAFRELLFTADGAEEHISGVIMYDETIRQATSEGEPFPEALARHGVMTGIKVDTGAKPLAGAPGELVTEGLDGLRERLAEYRELGARFAKWRAVIEIEEGLPTLRCVHANAHALARYAGLCQEAGLVPIVEPEVLMGGDHPIERSYEVTLAVLRMVFRELAEMRVELEGILLKPNMVLSGYDCPEQADIEEVAQTTLRCMREAVPPAVPGLVFLSGGQSDEAATLHLDAMNRIGGQPWELSFSYGRALQATPLRIWAGDPANEPAAREAYLERARRTAAARRGEYEGSPERELAPTG